MKINFKNSVVVFAFFCASSLLFAGGKKDKTSEKIQNPSEQTSESSEAQNDFQNQVESVEIIDEESPVFETEETVVNYDLHVGILNGPTAIPAAYLLDDPSRIADATVSFEQFASPVALLPKMIKGEIDIGFMPVNVAAKAYTSSNGAILLAGISGNGNITLITRDSNILSFADLKGKTVAVAGQGSTPDYMFRYLLSKNEVEVGEGADQVQLVFTASTASIVPDLLSGKIAYAVVPEPFSTIATMKDAGVRRVFDFQTEFEKVSEFSEGTSYPLTAVVVTKEYALENAEKVNAFLTALDASIAWTIANPQKSGVLVQKHTLGLMAPIVGKAIPNSNFVFEEATAARPRVESLLDIFLALDESSVGGKLPDDGFYFN